MSLHKLLGQETTFKSVFVGIEDILSNMSSPSTNRIKTTNPVTVPDIFLDDFFMLLTCVQDLEQKWLVLLKLKKVNLL